MNNPKLYIFDLDGTLYRGGDVVEHAPKVVNELVARGSLVRYITNNSAARPDLTSAKLQGLGFPCEPAWVYGTGPAAAGFAVRQGWNKVFVVGEDPLVQTCREAGLDVLNESDALEGQAEAVIVGICRQFTYAMLRAAQRAIVGGAAFIATNRDATFPVEGGYEDPGAGSIVAAVEVSSGQVPIVIGKPSATMLLDIIRDAHCSVTDSIVVGDRLDTDIAAGVAAGCQTFLVLTGVTKEIPGLQAGASDLRGLL